VHSVVEVLVAHETTRTVVWYKTLSSAATCELEQRHCNIVRFDTVSVSRVTGVVMLEITGGVVVTMGVVAVTRGDVCDKVKVTMGVVAVTRGDVCDKVTRGDVATGGDVATRGNVFTGGNVVTGDVVVTGDNVVT
jgi:hypothetical protein